jgi:hypothetical protein
MRASQPKSAKFLWGRKMFWADVADAKLMFPINLSVLESIKFETFMDCFSCTTAGIIFVHSRTRTFEFCTQELKCTKNNREKSETADSIYKREESCLS